MVQRLRVAVMFGGQSPEHDVSIVSGLQSLQALDSERYAGFPVYISRDGQWFIGEALADQAFYVPSARLLQTVVAVSSPVLREGRQPVMRAFKRRLFGRDQEIEFDVALLAFHGGAGESGQMQGLMEVAGIPYTGMRHLGSSIAMDKVATKRFLAASGIPTLPFITLTRNGDQRFLSRGEIDSAISAIGLPCIAKPSHLGSSIGVTRIDSAEDLEVALPSILSLDSCVIIERLVPNLVEYNVAVSAFNGSPVTSAIESPLSEGALLNFRKKYLSSTSGSIKTLATTNTGLLTMTRTINPIIRPEIETSIRKYATLAIQLMGMAGAPRIDFLCDEVSGELWLNEINPCPGSFAYFLWSAAEQPLLFTDLLADLISEAKERHTQVSRLDDIVPADARLFKRL